MSNPQVTAYCMKLKENVVVHNLTINRKYAKGSYRFFVKGTDPSGKYNVAKILSKVQAEELIAQGAKKGEWLSA